MKNILSSEVTVFLDDLHHPLINEINALRKTVIETGIPLKENIKWNGPNYMHENEDRITMRIQPPKQIQLIFHRGAKVKLQPPGRLIDDESGLMVWKENDRALINLRTLEEINGNRHAIQKLIIKWIEAVNKI